MTLHLVGFVDEHEFRHELTEGRQVIGRAPDCDIRITEPSVSRQHAAIVVTDGVAVINDLGSHNGTLVNYKRIEDATPIVAGDVVAIAKLTLQLEDERGPQPRFTESPTMLSGTALSWDEIQASGSSEEDKKSALFQVLAEAGELLTVPRAPDKLYEPILDLVETALKPQRTFLLLRESAEDTPVVTAARFKTGRDDENMVLSQTMVSRVLEQKTSFLTSDALTDPNLNSPQSVLAQRIRSAMAVPLFDNENVIGLLYADTSDVTQQFTDDELRAFTLLANVIAVALSHARYHAIEEEKRLQDAQLQAADDILQQILPAELVPCAGYECIASLDPCFEVGGDMYDLIRLDDGRSVVVIGDVVGKGLGAALLVSHILSLVRFMAEEKWEPAALVRRLNKQVFGSTDAIRFATLFVGYIEPATGQVVYVNAGHNPPFLVHADGEVLKLGGTGLPVGVLDDFEYKTGELNLAPGDLLMLYSDGVTETCDAEDEEYGEDRVERLLVARRSEPLAVILDDLRTELRDFGGDVPAADDVTVLMLRRDTE